MRSLLGESRPSTLIVNDRSFLARCLIFPTFILIPDGWKVVGLYHQQKKKWSCGIGWNGGTLPPVKEKAVMQNRVEWRDFYPLGKKKWSYRIG